MTKTHLAISILLFSSVAFAATTQKDPPPGNIKLLPGYQHKTLQGIDTRVGKIWKEGGLEIKYDIGSLVQRTIRWRSPSPLRALQKQHSGYLLPR
jgi:hypothetical protein